MTNNKAEDYLKRIIEGQDKTNALLQNLINILSLSFDMAIGGETFNRDFLEEDEIRKGINSG